MKLINAIPLLLVTPLISFSFVSAQAKPVDPAKLPRKLPQKISTSKSASTPGATPAPTTQPMAGYTSGSARDNSKDLTGAELDEDQTNDHEQQPTAAAAPAPTKTATTEAPRRSKRVPLNARRAIHLNYGYPAWNLDSAKIDSASLLMRDGNTGRIVQIHLEETEPDSSSFSGLFSINWENVDSINVEFYVPPQNLVSNAGGLSKVMTMITNGELKRLPFIVRRKQNGAQVVELFDKIEQARTAMRAYRNETQVAVQNKKFPSDAQVEAAKRAAELKAKEEAAKAEAERVRLEQIAARQAAEQLAKFNAMVAAEKAARVKKAADTAQEALALYQQGKFADAKTKFEEATKLDPANKGYYYQYAVSLYRTDDFNKAVVFFDLSNGQGVDPVEKQFFLGLTYYRLKDQEKSLESFDKVISSHHRDMAPSASFYKGIILFEQKNWSESQAAFQNVLDTSKDTALDERAEAYVEQILRIQQFELERSRKWQLSMTVGEQVDSNVLLQSDSVAAASATGKEGFRTLLMGSGRYRPIYDEKNEFAIQLDALTMYTLDKTFKVADSLRAADPTVATLTFPWAYKGLMFGKGYKLDVIPGYESTWMSVENNQNKVILSSYTLAFNNLFVMNDNWFANYNLELRSDQSKLTSSVGDDDSSALKVKLAFNNLIFVSDDKAKIVTANAAYTQNQAQGKNNIFNRIDLSVGYIQPTIWDMSMNTSLAYYLLNYAQKATARVDNDFTLSAGLSKKINETWSSGLTGSYTVNGSTDSTSQYSKYMIMLTLSALQAF